MLSKTIPSLRILAGLAMTAGLMACATPAADRDQDHAEHHPAQSAETVAPASPGGSAAQGGMGSGAMMGSQGGCGMMAGNTGGNQAGCGMHMDKDAMCAMYRNMRDAPTEQARQAMMDQNMKAMSPEMRQQHMEMMRQQCQ